MGSSRRHVCTHCGAETPQWAGRCPACAHWNTLVADTQVAHDRGAGGPAPPAPVALTDVDGSAAAPIPTGLDEADRVLGGGLVPGSVTLLAGEPGVGKSTLVLQVLADLARRQLTSLAVTAEESAAQVRCRAARLGAVADRVYLASDPSLGGLAALLDHVDPEVLVVDSVQTVHDPAQGSAPGSVAQVRHSAQHVVQLAKARGVAAILVGHVTKDGAVAGPRALEHLVDTVLEFDGDRRRGLRVLRATKHRFGSTDEIGLFEMGAEGLSSVLDPSAVFLADRVEGAPGTVIVPVVEGRRPVLAEVQALVGPRAAGSPRRQAIGLPRGRLDLVLAVLGRRLGVSVGESDVHVALVGGVHSDDPGLDLGVALAVTSAVLDRALPDDLVAFGEVGLAGELRRVAAPEARLAEASRLGLRKAVAPRDVADDSAELTLRRVASLADALRVVRLVDA